MPMNSFLTRTSPSLGSGTGRSVLYCRTSVPPVFSIRIPFIVLGIWVVEEDAMVRERGGRWLLRRESRVVGLFMWWGSLVRVMREGEGIKGASIGDYRAF